MCAAVAGSSLLLVACGGGNESTDAAASAEQVSPDARTLAAPGLSMTPAQRAAAATTVATSNPACASLTPFYWEIGDKSGRLASGAGGATSTPAPTASTPLPIASASKWIFSTYVAEKQKGTLSSADIKSLTFRSGYTNFTSCSSTSTVGSCLQEAGRAGGTNGDYQPFSDGKFFYNGGHMQVLANSKGLGPYADAPLGSNVSTVLGAELGLGYMEPQLPGGVRMSANGYAQFLRNLLNGKYHAMPALLGSNAVCTHTNGSDCTSALFSPVNQTHPGPVNDVSDERWHYSIGHWVEDDPTVGDGAYSSAGAFGFYPWVDHNKVYYGVLARANPTESSAGYHSAQCGRLIRKAWMNGTAP